MLSLCSLALVPGPAGRRVVAPHGSRWFTEVALCAQDEAPLEGRTAEEESALIVLSGTHDLEAGIEDWMQRGARATPFEGKPVVLFVPRHTAFRAVSTHGQLLRFAVRDHAPGDAVEFQDVPQILLPRHFRCEQHEGLRVEHLIPRGYKSRVLELDEAVMTAGTTLRLPARPGAEVAIFCRSEARLEARTATARLELAGEAVLWNPDASALELQAVGGRSYLAICYAAAKWSGSALPRGARNPDDRR